MFDSASYPVKIPGFSILILILTSLIFDCMSIPELCNIDGFTAFPMITVKT